jgi:hypothetical protein
MASRCDPDRSCLDDGKSCNDRIRRWPRFDSPERPVTLFLHLDSGVQSILLSAG